MTPIEIWVASSNFKVTVTLSINLVSVRYVIEGLSDWCQGPVGVGHLSSTTELLLFL